MPVLAVVFTRRAARQVEAVALWWAVNRSAAPNALRDDLAAGLALISEQPSCGSPVASRRWQGVRRIFMARIGYHVYYRLVPRLRQVQVVASWHARRGSGPKL